MNADYEQNKKIKVVLIFLLLSLLTIILISTLFSIKKSNKYTPNLKKKNNRDYSNRGSILTSENFYLTTSRQLFQAKVYQQYIDPEKKDLFIQLFSKYTNIPEYDVKESLLEDSNGVILSKNITLTQKKRLQELKRDLSRLKVFIPLSKKSHHIQGLDIEHIKETRLYPLEHTLSPYIGFIRENQGKLGLEAYYEKLLENNTDKLVIGHKDRNGVIIRDKDNKETKKENGYSIITNIKLPLQKKLEEILDLHKEHTKALEIIAAVMDSRTGKIIAVASSNRFNPSNILTDEIPYLKVSAVNYAYEPGSVMKTIFVAMLLDKNKIHLQDVINTHNGRYHYRTGELVTDEHKFQYLSVQNVVVHSSNIGMIELSQLANPLDTIDYLNSLGFAHNSEVDLSGEKSGSIPGVRQVKHTTIRGALFYGYGIRANYFQLLKAYNIFNNDGILIAPKIASFKLTQEGKKEPIQTIERKRVLSTNTAMKINLVLQAVVKDGTGKQARYPGLIIGGKTGTTEIPREKAYNSSFFGFANDKKSKYTIGVTVIKPDPYSAVHFASQSAVPTFRDIVQALVEEKLLLPTQPLVSP